MPELHESGAIEREPLTQPSLANADLGAASAESDESPDRWSTPESSTADSSTTESDDFGSGSLESPATPEAWSLPAPFLSPPGAVPETVPPQPGVALGQGTYIKRWKFLLILIGVWIPAAVAGLGLYYWWYVSLFKTWPLFVLLVMVVGCIVGGLLLAMVIDRPLVSAVAISVMSAPFAALIAAAVLHGAYFFQWIERPG